ncbi:MAG: xanthine dehydrogenase family protein subunit M [Burkholderiaceae bacterium]
MKPAAFEYERPESVVAALDLLAQDDDGTKIIAGGQSLVSMMNFRLARPSRLIDINRLPELDYIRSESGPGGNEIAIGALARHADVKSSALVAEACPLMHMSYEWVAHSAVRNRGTLCGNLCHADPASEMPAVALAVGATMVLRSRSGERRVAADDFFTGIFSTDARPDEMLIEVRVPFAPAGQKAGFSETSMRKGDFAWALAAALMTLRADKIEEVTITCGGVGDRPVRLTDVEAALIGQTANDALFKRAGDLAKDAVQPYGDAAVSAQYRQDLIQTLVPRALAQAAQS